MFGQLWQVRAQMGQMPWHYEVGGNVIAKFEGFPLEH
jgi:hypothetical protein